MISDVICFKLKGCVKKVQMSVQMFYGESADVHNVLIKSMTATHVFQFILFA